MCNTIQMYTIISLQICVLVFKLLFLIMFMRTNIKDRLRHATQFRSIRRYGSTLFITGLKIELLSDILFFTHNLSHGFFTTSIDVLSSSCLILGAAYLLKKYYITRNINFKYANPFILW